MQLKAKIDSASKEGALTFLPLLFYVFFMHSFASHQYFPYVAIVSSLSLGLYYFAVRDRVSIRVISTELVWILLLMEIVLNGADGLTGNLKYLIMVAGCLLLTIIMSQGRQWETGVINVLVAFACFHAVATIFFWIIPQVYPFVKEMFFANSYMASDYRSGFTAHYSTNAIYLSFGLVASACASFALKGQQKKRFIAIACLCLFALFLTTKRGPLAFSLASVVLVFFVVNRKKITGAVLKFILFSFFALLAFIAVYSIFPDFGGALQRFIDLVNDNTAGGRTLLYDHAWHMFQENPILGSGWGSYGRYLNSTDLGSMYSNLGFSSMSAHNVFLQLLAEGGLIGLLSFCIPATATLVACLKAIGREQSKDSDSSKMVLYVSLAIQVFFLLYCITGNPLYDPQCYVPYVIACGFVFSHTFRLRFT